ncbi:elongation factor Ts, mitochondrial [Tanacetum coccineum]
MQLQKSAAMMGEYLKLRKVALAMSMSKQGVIVYISVTLVPAWFGRIAGIFCRLILRTKMVHKKVVRHACWIRVGDCIWRQQSRYFLTKEARSILSLLMRLHKHARFLNLRRLRSTFEEVVSMEQKFIVNDTINVKTLLSELSKEVGSPVTIGNFLRVEVGEGLQR